MENLTFKDYFMIACQLIIIFDWLRMRLSQEKAVEFVTSTVKLCDDINATNEKYFNMYMKEYQANSARMGSKDYGKVKAGIGSGGSTPQ